MEYEDFILSKKPKNKKIGFTPKESYFNSNLFDYQKEILNRALENGRYALFMDTGLGKSLTQLNWAEAVYKHTNKNVLMLAPLAVSYQMVKEGEKFGIEVNHCKSQSDVKKGLSITNYESLHKFDTSKFNAVVLDESSILKSFMGKTKQALINSFKHAEYKLACTATPSPNDFLELGNHSEFLGVMQSYEMIMRFFINDTMNAGGYRLKGHAESDFWEWIASWADAIGSPSDLGYDGSRHVLPALNEIYHEISFDDTEYLKDDSLFSFSTTNATTISKNKKKTLDLRVEKALELLNGEPHMIWCDTNDEADALKKAIPNAVEVRGSHSEEFKAESALAFANGEIETMISKSSIFGFGLNFQNVHNMTFLGLNYSYESYYQAVRRMWRFGQKNEVTANIILADNERSILDNIQKKKMQHDKMKRAMQEAIIRAKVHQELKSNVFCEYTFPNFLKSKPII